MGTRPGVLHPARGIAPMQRCAHHNFAPAAALHAFLQHCTQQDLALFLLCCIRRIVAAIASLHPLHHCTHCIISPIVLFCNHCMLAAIALLHPSHHCTHCIVAPIALLNSLHLLQSCTPCVVASLHPLHPCTRCTLAPVVLCPPWALHPRPAPSRCSLPDAQEAIELELRTDSADGLLLWHGAVSRGTQLGHPPGEGTGTSPPRSPPPCTRRRTAKPKTSWGSA